ncbi:MAG: hypothetical protein WCR08_05575 [Gammaproteobacteria bacterium]
MELVPRDTEQYKYVIEPAWPYGDTRPPPPPVEFKQEALSTALCKAVLHPIDFNNYLFWELIYKKNLRT